MASLGVGSYISRMKRVIILVIAIIIIGSCGRKKDELSDSISSDILLLYNHNNPRLESIAKNNCNSDCQLVLGFAMKLRETSEEMMIQSGGVNKNGKFIDPYREGDVVLEIFNENNLHKSATDLVFQLNQKDSLSSNITKIKNVINFTFTQNEGIMAKDKAEKLPISIVCLELLILENLIYAHLIEEN